MDNSESPLISIVTVVYNAAHTISDSIESVLSQSYNKIEYLIIDGMSTDGTLEILERFKHRLNFVSSEKDGGIYHAMNKALRHANGDWIFFLGADDLMLSPLIIEELVPLLKSPDIIYYGDTYLKHNNKIYQGKVNKWSLCLGNISHQAILYPKHIYKNKPYDTTYRLLADHVYNIQLFGDKRNQFAYLPKVFTIYNDLGASSINKDRNYELNIIKIVTQNFGWKFGVYLWIRRKASALKQKLRR